MLITKRVQDAYRGELGRLESAAADYVESYLEAIRKAAPNASVAEVREVAKAAIEDSLNIFGDQAGALACELFDETMSREGIDAQAQLYSDTIDLDMMDEKVRYYARDLLSDDGPSFVGKVTDLTRFYVKRSAYENMVRNCSSHLVRYARVPSGRETCSFCFMLASRGFVYHSEQTAEGRGLHGVHDHCDCIIVPGVPGETEIDGYDPVAMERRWRQCAETIGVDPDDAYRLANRKTVMKEVETRDWRWLYEGRPPEYSAELGATPDEWEKRTGELLRGNGLCVEFRKRSLENRDRRSDTLIDGIKYELKNPSGSGELSVHNQIKKNLYGTGKSKILNPQSSRVVISNVRSVLSFEELIEQAEDVLSGATRFTEEELACIDEIVILDKSGKMRRVKK